MIKPPAVGSPPHAAVVTLPWWWLERSCMHEGTSKTSTACCGCNQATRADCLHQEQQLKRPHRHWSHRMLAAADVIAPRVPMSAGRASDAALS